MSLLVFSGIFTNAKISHHNLINTNKKRLSFKVMQVSAPYYTATVVLAPIKINQLQSAIENMNGHLAAAEKYVV